MIRLTPRIAGAIGALCLIAVPAACSGKTTMAEHPNSIQPETTLDIAAEATVNHEPDIAYISAGVQEEAKTAKAAMAANARAMNGVFSALEKAGIEKRDMQTSNFSLQPRYDYVKSSITSGSGQRKLMGYTASNQLSVKVRNLAELGPILDSLVSAGGNTFNGVRFAVDDDTPIRNEARQKAMAEALSKAELYAEASNMKIARIVSISEGGDYSPQPQMMMARGAMKESDSSTPIAGGEIGYTARVNVQFQLK